MSNSLNNDLKSAIEKRKQQIIEEIASAYKQLGISLSEVDKTRIQRQIDNLELELEKINTKLNSQPNPPTTTKPILISNLPERNRFFTGREDVLNQLTELLKSNREVAIKQAIAGLGGIGKTQTAIEFCYRHINNDSNNYQTFLWVRSENEIDFNNSYYELAKLLRLLPSTSSEPNQSNQSNPLKIEQIVDLVKDWLATNSNWLMVLDNLEDPGLVKQYLPNNHQGHILITTRANTLGHFAKSIKLEKMDSYIGSLFLLRRAGLLQENDSLDKAGEVNKKLANELVTAMDGLPLALEQAGAYIEQTQCSLSDYLIAYKDVRNTVTILDNDGEDTNDHKSVFTTFKLAFDKVKEISSIAADLLQVCSMLSPDSIPEEIFTQAGDLLGDELTKVKDNPFEFNKVIKTLLNYSLIERDTNNKSISIHRLVQAVIRELMDDSTKKIWFENLVNALEELRPSDAADPKNWPKYQRLLPSASALFEIDIAYNFLASKAATLFHQFGFYCYTQALFTQSLSLYNQALVIYKHHFGDNHPDVASILNNIAGIYYSHGNYEQALDLYNQVLAIYKHHFGDNHPDVATSLNNIAMVYDSQGNYEQALALYNQALAISKHHFGDNHPDVARTLNNIAVIYHKQGNYEQALALYNQALTIRKHHFSDNHPSVASTLNNIAVVYYNLGNYEQALDLYNQALPIYKHHFGDNHPDVALTLNNIAAVYDKQGNYQQALDLYNQALTIYKHHFGDNHPDVAHTLNNIALVYSNLGNYQQALALYNQALTIRKHHFGDNHPDVAGTLNNIAAVYDKQSNYDQALALYNQALAIYKHHFGDNHPSIATSFNNIAYVYDKQGNYDQALALYNQALPIYKHHFGDNHLDVALTLNNIAAVYCKQGNYPKALDLYNQALTIKKHHFDDNHPDIALTLWHLASVYASTSKKTEAIEYYKQALSIFDQFLPSNHPWIIQLLEMYPKLLLKLNRNDEAQPLLTRLESLNLSD